MTAVSAPRVSRSPSSRRRFRRRLWLSVGVAAMFEVQLVTAALRALVRWPDRLLPVMVASMVLVPLGAAMSTVPAAGRRTDQVVRGGVALIGLTGLVVGSYMLVVLGALGAPDRADRGLLIASMAAAAVVGVCFTPVRTRLSEVANNILYGESRDPAEALRTFGSRLSRAVPMDELLLQLVESLRKSMGLARAEVWTGSGGRFSIAVSVPHGLSASVALNAEEQEAAARAGVAGPAWLEVWMPGMVDGRGSGPLRVAAAAHGGKLIGLIVVQRPDGDEQFNVDDEVVLAELGRRVGLALHNIELDSALEQSLAQLRVRADELRASRARVVAAGDAERRKIERNIHDGAQQHLVALRVSLRIATDTVHEDPDAAVQMLQLLNDQVQDAVEELRALSHGIYPPLLRSGGLVEALPAAAMRAPLPTTVDCAGVARHPEEIEAAIYFCCVEALQNAGKHAGADATISVHVEQSGGAIRFEVADTGVGFDPADGAGSGAGFVNMADRLGAVGGEVVVESAVGSGVRVVGVIPVQPDGSTRD